LARPNYSYEKRRKELAKKKKKEEKRARKLAAKQALNEDGMPVDPDDPDAAPSDENAPPPQEQ
jgi:hypothetical protein